MLQFNLTTNMKYLYSTQSSNEQPSDTNTNKTTEKINKEIVKDQIGMIKPEYFTIEEYCPSTR